MDTVLLIGILSLLVVVLLLGLSFLFVFARIMGIDLTVSFRKTKDTFTENTDKGVPILNFKPDFKKPLKVKYNDKDIIDDTNDKYTPL